MPITPDVQYSGYTIKTEQENKCCRNCKFYIPTDDNKGLCYEYEVLPYAGCKFFEEKEN